MKYKMEISIHEKYMKLCFELANKGAGYVSPNPLVGAAIVQNDRLISTGYHGRYGSAHAERNAIDNANKEELYGATLYCNLEPCVHMDKQTPPCVPLIIDGGIKKVVISNIDPNPKVNGEGIRILKEAGIEVITGVLEEEGKELNRFFFKLMQTGLPYVTVKIAASLDGKFSAAEGVQTWLTGDASKKFVHKQRSIYDVVLIGANTVNVDNPKLTVREVEGRNPVRIILDGNLNSVIESNVFNDKESRTIILCSVNADEKKKNDLAKRGIEIIEFGSEPGSKINLEKVLQKLAAMKISSLFVEGGGQVFYQFISQHLFDEVLILKAPVTLHDGVNVPVLDNEENLYHVKTEKLDNDILTIYRKAHPHPSLREGLLKLSRNIYAPDKSDHDGLPGLINKEILLTKNDSKCSQV